MNDRELRFGRLSVLEDLPRSEWQGRDRTVLCQCDCGETTIVLAGNLKAGRTKSCGCLRKKHGHAFSNGVKYPSPTYRTWRSMKQRCLDPKQENYSRYGGRGIAIHPDWLDFENFLKDMGERPEGTTLDRINNDGNYEPENCRWATHEEQTLNRRVG